MLRAKSLVQKIVSLVVLGGLVTTIFGFSFERETEINSTLLTLNGFQKKALTSVTVIDGNGGQPKVNQTIIIADGKIAEIFATGSRKIPNDAEVLDFNGKFVIPGMIDSHVHLATQERNPEILKELLRATLLGGVTSVRDMGGNGVVMSSLQDAFRKGEISSPRMFYSAIMAGEGSRWFNGSYLKYASNGMTLGSAPWARLVSETENIPQIVKDAKSTGATAIKIYGSLSPLIVQKLTDEAKRQNLKVWSHGTVKNNKPSSLATMKINSLSHADQLAFENIEGDVNFDENYSQNIKNAVNNTSFNSDKITDLLKLMKRENVILDDTLYIIATGIRRNPNDEQARKHFDFACQVTRRAKEMGVTVAAGTDAIGGSSPNLHVELQLLVNKCGFTPLEAITSATLNGAKAIGNEKELGTIEKGKTADLVILRENPAEDIRNTQTVEAVMQNGMLFKREKPMPIPPFSESPVANRIKNVENGLLPAVLIKGKTTAMTLTNRMAFYKTPAVSIAVINNGKIEWAKAYGNAEKDGKSVTTETLFQAGSISKPVAGILALNLAEKGKFGLDEDVNKKLTSWKISENEFTKDKKVTPRHLLTHSSGLTVHGFDGYATDKKTPSVVQILDGEKPVNSAPIRVDFVPGSRERYSGGGFTVLQLLLTDTTGKSFEDLADKTIFRRLQMSNSTFHQPLPTTKGKEFASGHLTNGEILAGKWHLYPEMAAAGLWTTPTDLAKLIIEMQKSFKGESNKILSKEMTQTMMTRQNPTIPNSDAGLGFFLKGSPQPFRFSHNGSTEGFNAVAIGFLETGQGAIVMTNSDDDSQLLSEVLRSIAAEYGWNDMKPDEVSVAEVNPQIYAEYTGSYKFSNGTEFVVSVDGERLFIAPTGRGKVELLPENETTFRLIMQGVPRLTFIKNEQGKTSEIILVRNGREEKGVKVRFAA